MKTMTPHQEPKPENRGQYVRATIEVFRSGKDPSYDEENKYLSHAASGYHTEVLALTDDEYDNPFADEGDLEELAELYDDTYALRVVRKDEAVAVARVKEELRASRLTMRP